MNRPNKILSVLLIPFILVSVICFVNMGAGNVEALDPHVVSGVVYEANGTVLTNANVTILNVRTGESSNNTSNATGVYAYNILNLPGDGWCFGDTIQVNTTNATGIGGINSTQILIGTTSTIIDIWIGSNTTSTGINFYIIDIDGAQVESALINIKDISGDIVTTKLSDSNGKTSTILSNGIYLITVAKTGFDDVVSYIKVHGTNTYSIILGERVEVERTTGIWTWLMLFLIVSFVIGILIYLSKKV